MAGNESYNIFYELKEWSKDLEVWQRAALLALLQKGELTSDDKVALYEEFKVDSGLEEAPEERKTYQLEESCMPRGAVAEEPLRLKTIRNVKGVNALVEGQELRFGDNLTVVYGPNGSGKSGYARILKAACFTRSKEKDILGNVHEPPEDRPDPACIFEFSNGTEEQFEYNKVCSQLVDNFAVFDRSCVRVYTDQQNEFNVSPYGFDIFPGLVGVTEDIRTAAHEEIQERTPDLDVFLIENSTSLIAQSMKNLSASTDLQKLENLSVFEEDDHKRVKNLETQIAEVIKKDPQELIKLKKRQVKDIKTIIEKCKKIVAKLTANSTIMISETIAEILKLEELSKANSIAQFGDEPVQPVGTEAWTTLIEAAINYSLEAYPELCFPASVGDARCVLCQQSLDNEGARERLSRFHVFVRSTTEQKLKGEVDKLSGARGELDLLDISFFEEESTQYRTIEDLDSSLLITVNAYVKTCKSIRGDILKCIDNKKMGELDSLPTDLIPSLIKTGEQLEAEIEKLKTQDISEIKKKLNEELQLLRDRLHLNKIFSKVKKAVQNLKWIEKAQAVVSSLRSVKKKITYKQKALTEMLLAKGFIEVFQEECGALGFKLPLDIKILGGDGTTSRKMIIGATSRNLPDPSRVLSEGEQTAVALADFLTEVGIDERQVGIVFDDPVTSMDHIRKELIAKRLVQEAKTRQVIVFTHDILLTHHLAQAAVQNGTGFMGRTASVGSVDGLPGYLGHAVFPYSHYEGETAKEAQKYLDKAKKLVGQEQEEKLRLGCGSLRTAYENFIQKKLFNDVVGRWREEIKAFSMSDVCHDEDTIRKVEERMAFLSRYIDAHAHTAEFHENPLTVEILQSEVNAFHTIAKEYRAKANKYREKRKKDKKVFS